MFPHVVLPCTWVLRESEGGKLYKSKLDNHPAPRLPCLSCALAGELSGVFKAP